MVVTTEALIVADALVSVDVPGSPDRSLVTLEEYNRLPPNCRHLHGRLIGAPEGMKHIFIAIPPGMFLYEG